MVSKQKQTNRAGLSVRAGYAAGAKEGKRKYPYELSRLNRP